MKDRQDRLAKALRENLRRRKEQARGRATGEPGAPDVRDEAVPGGVPGGPDASEDGEAEPGTLEHGSGAR